MTADNQWLVVGVASWSKAAGWLLVCYLLWLGYALSFDLDTVALD